MAADVDSVNSRAKRPYHHGRLREALLEGALALAQEGGPAAVGVREVARRAGVSPTAAYRHFSSREDLVTAVRDEAMLQLAARMRAEAAEGERSAAGALRATGAAYVQFALDEPGLFRAAFTPCPTPPGGTEEDDPYALLGAALDGLVDEGRLTAEGRTGAEQVAWACVHGVAQLVLEGQLPDEVEQAVRERRPGSLLDRVLDVIREGLVASSPTATASSST
ncbi:TetR/AcrR family transcriptional regulator [Motilibacter aurantiacus]|uniref:TetR/AcrR family transcriptional regulator n=1 Tax=Motilibacter aurantiacus TaxID=2714955 RepID=UPI0014079C7D|nr:TetR/AcrR family transcriptional regulator [Motilibacter aurantiacus]NHC44476.1 TetR/AcrR family transcriptional regulator [Motilibacter aurantiacus]